MRDYEDNEFDEELDDDQFDDDDSAETVSCPECGAEVYEESPHCPHCGAYIVHDTSVWSGRSLWWIVLGLLGTVAVILALALRF